ncbi:MAG: diaminopimelate decarboxylase [Chloroflexota bacterium]|nr:diaminopimelate decarboxylase [Chloroflexota bacterium]
MFHYQAGQLYAEGVPLTALAAEYDTPLYVYSRATLAAAYDSLTTHLGSLGVPLLVCYALKANANPALARLLAERGAGVDVVSGGELYVAQHSGFPADRIVFAGVGKTRPEMAEALRAPGIRAFHIESRSELEALGALAAGLGVVAPIALRVNPDVEAHTHPYITTGTAGSKFGVPPAEALALTRWAATHPHLRPVGLHAHIGSQMADVAPIIESTRRLLALWDVLAAEGIPLRSLDIGGGLAIPYEPDDAPQGPEQLAAGLRPLLAGRRLELELEPGRYLLGPAGVLLTRVLYHKPTVADRQLLIADAGMNDLLRPALYGAYHPVEPLQQPSPDDDLYSTDLAGPICESSDLLATERMLPLLGEGALLAIRQAGAYGFSMASQYNSRPRPAEVLVTGTTHRLIRPRETYADLLPRSV